MNTDKFTSEEQIAVFKETFQQNMSRRRDDTIKGIAMGVLLVGGLVILVSLWMAIANPDAYSRVKDILLFVNPFLGVVIGYYFQKAVSDSRAEAAESAISNANAAARAAQTERQLAQDSLQTAQQKLNSQRDALSDLKNAAENALANGSAISPASKGLPTPGDAPDATEKLVSAIARAQTALEQ
jgi:3-methyladenine DNA glycosylase/8-oxoguanine DNA glycosylase